MTSLVDDVSLAATVMVDFTPYTRCVIVIRHTEEWAGRESINNANKRNVSLPIGNLLMI
jgi:hypothetical protein